MGRKTETLDRLASLVHGDVLGDGDFVVRGVNGLEHAGPDELTFISRPRDMGALARSRAGACIVPRGSLEPDRPAIAVDNPSLAAAIIHGHFIEEPFRPGGIHATAVIHSTAQVPAEVTIGPHASVGPECEIGPGTRLHPGVVLERGVVLGEGCELHARVVICRNCRLGKNVVVHPGAVIGADGFGYVATPEGRHVKRPQVGTVEIGDQVEIGANVCIDRATFGVTRIGAGTKIDNLVQVGHNVDIGEDCLLVSQVGVAGSSTLGRGVVLAARAGVGDHCRLGDRAVVAAMGGVHGDLDPGQVVGGIPAIDVRRWGRAVAVFSRLPELQRDVRRLKRAMQEAVKERGRKEDD